MPRYDYHCEECNLTWESFHTISERESEVCGKCGKRAKQLLSMGATVQTFTPHVYEDITDHPIEVTSKRQLKELCKVHNVKAVRLM